MLASELLVQSLLKFLCAGLLGASVSDSYRQSAALGGRRSVHSPIVGFVELVEGEVHGVCGDGLSVQRIGGHFIAGPGSLALELGEFPPIVDGDKQLPDGQKGKPHQQDAAYHSQQDGCGIGGGSTLWFSEDCQVGPPVGELCVGEQHDTVLGSFVEAKHRLLVILSNGVCPGDYLILAQNLAGVVVSWAPRVQQQALHTLSLGATGIRAGGALLTRLPKGSRLCALALTTDAVSSATADLAVLGPARAGVRGTVTVVSDVTWLALAFSTVTLTMT